MSAATSADARKSDGDERADAVCTRRQPDLRAVALRDLAHDGEPQPATLGSGAEHAVKALEHVLAFGFGYARPVILDTEHWTPVFRGNPHCDAAAMLRVADRVVEQIAEHFPDKQAVRFDQRRRAAIGGRLPHC